MSEEVSLQSARHVARAGSLGASAASRDSCNLASCGFEARILPNLTCGIHRLSGKVTPNAPQVLHTAFRSFSSASGARKRAMRRSLRKSSKPRKWSGSSLVAACQYSASRACRVVARLPASAPVSWHSFGPKNTKVMCKPAAFSCFCGSCWLEETKSAPGQARSSAAESRSCRPVSSRQRTVSASRRRVRRLSLGAIPSWKARVSLSCFGCHSAWDI
mmetsp:Transcript_13104/g.30619  ORF Transcript_13104/g.30619 Transcript_13104/m.30619 type:complete len:217 (+) Transcript_13104:297-947(+)